MSPVERELTTLLEKARADLAQLPERPSTTQGRRARNDRVTAIRRFGGEPAAPASLRRVSAAEDVMSTCRHCGQPAGGFNDGFRTCGSCAVLLAGMPNEPEPEPVPVPARAQLDLDALFREEGESRLHCWKVQRLNLLRRARRERAVQPK